MRLRIVELELGGVVVVVARDGRSRELKKTFCAEPSSVSPGSDNHSHI